MYKTRYYVYITITVLVAFIGVMNVIAVRVLDLLAPYWFLYSTSKLACLVFLVSVIGLLGKIHRDITGEQ